VIESLGKFTDIRSCLVVGGLSNQKQETQLREKPDVVIGTPGRVIDHLLNARSFGLDDIEILVLDEADRLLDMGFADELRFDYSVIMCSNTIINLILFLITVKS